MEDLFEIHPLSQQSLMAVVAPLLNRASASKRLVEDGRLNTTTSAQV